jgi:uncharacterized membrane protein HdeD (DUF308 family)
MVSSGPSPLAAVRGGMWGFLLFAGVAWLAISWSVLRLEPADIVQVAGPVVLFGALMEAVRALAGTRTWWLNAGMAVLFAATGILVLAGSDSSFATPAALVGWFLMVRGAADVAVAMMSRETDRIWGLLLVVGVGEAALGFFAAGPFARSPDLMVSVLGALGLLRGVADLVTALRLREVPRVTSLELPPERAAGVAGYSAGLTDFESAPSAESARHRAASRLPSAAGWDVVGGPGAEPSAADEPTTWHAAAGPAAPGLDPVLGTAGPGRVDAGTSPENPGTGRAALGTGWATAGAGPAGTRPESARPESTASESTASESGASFHDEVLRTTADLDMMLALAGVTGAAVGVPLREFDDLPEMPDTPEGAELPKAAPPVAETVPLEDPVAPSGESAKPVV